MLFRMLRSQTDGAETLHAGVAYDATDNPRVAALGKRYIEAGFAEAVTAAQLRREKAEAETLAAGAAPQADADPATSEGTGEGSGDGSGEGAAAKGAKG